MKCFLFFAFLLVTIDVFAQIKDTIYLKNGSMIIGKVKTIKLGVITFDPDDAGDITVQLQKLSSMAAVIQLFRIETTENKVFFGFIVPSGIPGVVTVLSGLDSINMPLVKISVLYPFKNEFKRRFSGNVAAGFDYTRSSGLGRINLDGTVNYRARREEIVFSAAGTYTITDSSLSRDREDVAIKYNNYFNSTWFGTLFLRTQRNLELGLLRRYQEGLGGGNKFITSKQLYAWARCGVVINQEENTEDVKSGTLTELFGQTEFNFFRFVPRKLTVNLTEAVYYSLSQTGRIRNDVQVGLIWELVKDLNISLSAYSNFDSQPANADSRKMDIGTDFSFSLIF